jgi:hypothetical protein
MKTIKSIVKKFQTQKEIISIEKKCKNFSRLIKIYYIGLIGPSFQNYQSEREAVFKLQFEHYWLKYYCLKEQNAEFTFLIFQFLLKNPNLDPDAKGFEEPNSSLPSRYRKNLKDFFKTLKKKNYLKEIPSSLTSLYQNYPYKYILLALLALSTVAFSWHTYSIYRDFQMLRLGYISNYLIELNHRLRLIELLEKYKEAKFLKPKSFQDLAFHKIPMNNPLTKLQSEDLKNLNQVINENKLQSRALIKIITELSKQLNLNPKATCTLMIMSLLLLRLRKDSPETGSFIILVKFLLQILGSNDRDSWTDPNDE